MGKLHSTCTAPHRGEVDVAGVDARPPPLDEHLAGARRGQRRGEDLRRRAEVGGEGVHHRAVAVQLAFDSKIVKPVFSFIASTVETRRFQSYESTAINSCTAPPRGGTRRAAAPAPGTTLPPPMTHRRRRRRQRRWIGAPGLVSSTAGWVSGRTPRRRLRSSSPPGPRPPWSRPAARVGRHSRVPAWLHTPHRLSSIGVFDHTSASGCHSRGVSDWLHGPYTFN
jgi:hypothetical protein